MKKTAIYARYSSHAQDGGTSIEVQLDACRRDLQPKTYREYVDRARTGRSMAGREACSGCWPTPKLARSNGCWSTSSTGSAATSPKAARYRALEDGGVRWSASPRQGRTGPRDTW